MQSQCHLQHISDFVNEVWKCILMFAILDSHTPATGCSDDENNEGDSDTSGVTTAVPNSQCNSLPEESVEVLEALPISDASIAPSPSPVKVSL